MFQVVAEEFNEGPRNAQKRWPTFVREVRTRLKTAGAHPELQNNDVELNLQDLQTN